LSAFAVVLIWIMIGLVIDTRFEGRLVCVAAKRREFADMAECSALAQGRAAATAAE
jgi:hypothetical protein